MNGYLLHLSHPTFELSTINNANSVISTLSSSTSRTISYSLGGANLPGLLSLSLLFFLLFSRDTMFGNNAINTVITSARRAFVTGINDRSNQRREIKGRHGEWKAAWRLFDQSRASPRCTNVQMLALTSRADRRTGRRWWRRRLHKTDRSQIFHRSPIPEDVPRSRGHRSQGRRNLRRSAWSCSNWSCCSRCHCRTLPRWALWKKKISVIRRIRKIISYLVFFFFFFHLCDHFPPFVLLSKIRIFIIILSLR